MNRIPPWLEGKLKSPVVVATAVRFGVLIGQDTRKLIAGELDRKAYKRKLAEHVGTMTGTASGALAGAWLGSVVPGVGTVLGAFGGALAGELAGEYAVSLAAQGSVGGSTGDDDDAESSDSGGEDTNMPSRTGRE